MTAEEAIADANILHPELSNSTAASAYVQNIPAPPHFIGLEYSAPRGWGLVCFGRTQLQMEP